MTWITLELLENNYAINEIGQLKNIKTGNIKANNPDKEGYVRYVVDLKGKAKAFYAHRLVAMAFLSNPENHPVVHHKNNIRDDNRLENLEWCSVKHNRNFAFVTCPCCGTKVKV
jgi:hypothetical protein